MPDHLLLPHQNRAPDDFSLHRESIVISHYQLYAVEKYILQRTPFRHLLVVYTGDPAHSVTFDAFTPNNQAVWATTIATLRADGAKQKVTTHGTILVTSLAHFRSDYNIIKIPTGNFLSVRDQLYSNVDLLRMGCFGRTALTLEDPSDVTKERFISSFYLPENTVTPAPNPVSVEHLPQTSPTRPSRPRRNTVTSNTSTTSLVKSSRDTREKVVIGKTKDAASFVPTVLELIKLIQAGLAVFGLFPEDSTSVQRGIFLDGLLCDNTVKGIKKWITRVGGPCLGLEQSERVVDPKFVAGLISMVLAIRNQLAYLGYSYYLPRDPFFHPYAFSCTVNAYLQSTAPPAVAPGGPAVLGPSHHHHAFISPSHSVVTSTPMIPAAPPANSVLSAAAAAAASLASNFSAANAPPNPGTPTAAALTKDTVDALQVAYDNKQRSESRKVRRVIKNKLVAAVDSDGDGGGNALALALTKSLSDGEREPTHAHHQSLSLATTVPGGQDGRQGMLSGLGSSLASGMRGGGAALASVAGVGSAGDGVPSIGDPGTLYAPTIDLGALTIFIVGRAGLKTTTAKKTGVDGVVARTKDRAKRMSRDIGKIGGSAGVGGGIGAGKDFMDAGSDSPSPMISGLALTYAYEKERDRAARDSIVASSVKALWGGRVVDLIRMREDVEAAGPDGPERWSTNCGANSAGSTGTIFNGPVPGAGTGGGWTGAAGWGGVTGNMAGSNTGNTGAADGKRWLSGLKAEKTAEKESDITNFRKKRGLSPSSMASDAEDGGLHLNAKRGQPYDGRSTEEESDVLSSGMGGTPFGAMQWPGKMRGKLEGWAGKARRKGQSADLSATSSQLSGLAGSTKGTPMSVSASNSARSTIKEPSVNNGSAKNANDSPQPSLISNPAFYNSYKTQSTLAQRQPGRLQTTGLGIRHPSIRSAASGYRSASASRAQSPTLPPMLFSGDGERDVEDDDLLSSGQVSPLSDDRPNPFGMVSDDNASMLRKRYAASGASSTTNLTPGGLIGGSMAATESGALDAKLLMLAQQKPGDRKRPWFGRSLSHSARVSSWADPVSARDEGEDDQSTPMIYSDEDDDESLPPLSFGGRRDQVKGKRRKSNERDPGTLSVSEEDIEGEEESDVSRMGGYHLAPQRAGNIGGWKRSREKARFHSLLSIVDDGGVLAQEPLEESDDEGLDSLDHGDDMQASFRRKWMLAFDPTRRRSFHDLDSFRDIEVLPVDYMKIDVSMCGQLLIIYRREEHLRNVIDCVRLLSDSIAQTNAGLREHYDSHMPTMPEIEERAGVLADLDAENARAERIFQATNTLSYETEQFRVRDLWQTASPSRRKVFEMREKVFGDGGRRLPTGVHGAHGPYNRLQWTLDGEKRLVDSLGRTESEAEEEDELDSGPKVRRPLEQIVLEEEVEEGEEEENVVKHPTIKPMWLLRFFTSWGARWSAAASSAPAQAASISDAAVKGDDEKGIKPNNAIDPPTSAPAASENYTQAQVQPEKVPTRAATHPT